MSERLAIELLAPLPTGQTLANIFLRPTTIHNRAMMLHLCAPKQRDLPA